MIKAGKLRLLPTKEQELLFFSFCNISDLLTMNLYPSKLVCIMMVFLLECRNV